MESTKKHRNKTTRGETLLLAIEKEALFSPLFFFLPLFLPLFFCFLFYESLNSLVCSLRPRKTFKKTKKNLLFFRLFFPHKKRVFKEKALKEGKDAQSGE